MRQRLALFLLASSALALAGCFEASDTTVTPASASTKRVTEDHGDGSRRSRVAFAPVPETAPTQVAKADPDVAVISTSEGDITIGFRSDRAPATVENFKKLAKAGFYNGTAFHRIVKGFMIQGGDPLTKDLTKKSQWGQGGPGYAIKAEFNDLHHVRGTVSMARSSSPDSAGSQFFICDGTAAFLDGQYTAFGQVLKGDDVLAKIANTPVTPGPGGENSVPTQRIEVKTVSIVPAGVAK